MRNLTQQIGFKKINVLLVSAVLLVCTVCTIHDNADKIKDSAKSEAPPPVTQTQLLSPSPTSSSSSCDPGDPYLLL